MAESFFAAMECELLHRHRFRTRTQARVAARHSGELTPAQLDQLATDLAAGR